MDPRALFAGQLLWFLAVWTTLAALVVWPWSRTLAAPARIAVWIAPQMFRVLGVGLLVPALSPGMPPGFATATAIGDTTTSVLALLAFAGLMLGWRAGVSLAWACTVVGSVDLVVAMGHAAGIDAHRHLAAQWYVPVLVAPAMAVSHVGAALALLRHRRPAGAGPAAPGPAPDSHRGRT